MAIDDISVIIIIYYQSTVSKLVNEGCCACVCTDVYYSVILEQHNANDENIIIQLWLGLSVI